VIYINKKWLVAPVCIVIIAAVLAYVNSTDNATSVYIYYFNTLTNELEPEQRRVTDESLSLQVQAMILLLYEPPRNSSLRQTIPGDLLFDNVLIEGSDMLISFPATYHRMEPQEEALFRTSLVWTMTQLPYIESVAILVDGSPLINSFGGERGPETRNNVLINPVITPMRLLSRTIALYFINEDLSGLVAEERTIEVGFIGHDVNLERYIIDQLIEGTEIAGRFSGIPTGTRIREVRTEGGICTIDFSEEFVANFTGELHLAELTIQSILHSITENVGNVRSVQFLIEAERREQFGGVQYFDSLFERD